MIVSIFSLLVLPTAQAVEIGPFTPTAAETFEGYGFVSPDKQTAPLSMLGATATATASKLFAVDVFDFQSTVMTDGPFTLFNNSTAGDLCVELSTPTSALGFDLVQCTSFCGLGPSVNVPVDFYDGTGTLINTVPVSLTQAATGTPFDFVLEDGDPMISKVCMSSSSSVRPVLDNFRVGEAPDLLDCADPAISTQACEAAVLAANTINDRHPGLILPAGSGGRFDVTRIYNQFVNLESAALAANCSVFTTIGGGDYSPLGWDGDDELGPMSGGIVRVTKSITGTLGSGAVMGDLFSGYNKHRRSLANTGGSLNTYMITNWIRIAGTTGVFASTEGTCNGDASIALEPWFGTTL